MALTANGIVPKNRVLSPISSPIPNLRKIPNNNCKFNLQSGSLSLIQCKSNRQPNTRLSTVSYVAKTPVSDVEAPASTSTGGMWSEFARNVSGEWDGYGADFSAEGNPIELPESVVPEAYREWEVKVFDWQTQCPTLAQRGERVLAYKSIKLLPTVGCEADAATRYSVDERYVGGVDNGVAAFAYQTSGCYVAAWPAGYDGNSKLVELEHCLVNPQDKESRVRIIQAVRVDGTKMGLVNIRVFCEQWYGPFRGGDQLGGCAIRDSAFASTAAMKRSQVVGVWQGANAVAKFGASQNDFIQELLEDSIRKAERDECGLILLPKQLWCSLKESEDGGTCSEVGWLFDHGHAIISRCTFSCDAKLKEMSIAREAAAAESV